MDESKFSATERVISSAGDPFSAKLGSLGGGVEQRDLLKRASLRCNEEFLHLLEEDFGISMSALRTAFMGFPRELKATALIVCALAEDQPDPGRYVLRWSRLVGAGAFARVPEEQDDA